MREAELIRLGIDGALLAVGVAPNSATGQQARALDALRKASACVDHVERRTTDALKRGRCLDAYDVEANRLDLDEAARLVGILGAAHEAAGHLVRSMCEQVENDCPIPPSPYDDLAQALGVVHAQGAEIDALRREKDALLGDLRGAIAGRADSDARAGAAEAELHRLLEAATAPVPEAQ